MRVVILQSNYLPWKGYFDLMRDADCFIYYDEVQYTKNDWRNRNRIACRHGIQWLTIPIRKDAVHLKISDVTLDDPRWQKKHLNAIQSCYGRAPFYSDLSPLLYEAYQRRSWKRLSELNRYLIRGIANGLGIETRFVDSADLFPRGDRVGRLIDILKKIGASEYLSGPAAKGYLSGSEYLFEESGIRLVYKDYSGYPTYPQYGGNFEHCVSIIDLIAHVGFEAAPDFIWGRYRVRR